jgi:hypothetical protein
VYGKYFLKNSSEDYIKIIEVYYNIEISVNGKQEERKVIHKTVKLKLLPRMV